MPSYTLEIEAFGVYATDIPSLEIWEDGVLDSTHSITSSGSSISVTINYPGTIPTSLALTFNDGLGEGGRTIEIQSVKINDKYVNVGNYLSSDSLVKFASATVDISSSEFIFDASDPAGSEFTTGATRTLTVGADQVRSYTESTDEVYDALGGRDIIYSGSGNDKISGGAGDDVIRGGDGNDLLFGAADNDRLFGEDGDDRLYGGTGNDRIHGGDGDDEIHGGDGDDRLNGNENNDTITGGAGADKITGGNGIDYLFGGTGNDMLSGGAGADTLDGGDGADIIYGGAGVDHLDGGDGDDVIVGDTGDDILNGGAGDDTIFGFADDDEIYGGDDDDEIYGGAGLDVIDGGDGVNDMYGGDGDDIISAEGGAYNGFFGGAGDDVLNGSSGIDSMFGEEDDDTIYGNAGADYIQGADGNDTIEGGTGDDEIYGGDDVDNISGGDDNDIIHGEGGVDTIDGDDGNDVLVGGEGADIIEGGIGNDILHGHGLGGSVITAILDANAGVSYNAATNSFYQYVETNLVWSAANAAAQGSMLAGIAGHLANVTTATENAYLDSIIGADIWLNATDEDVEGLWGWNSGAEEGMIFWNGDETGSSPGSAYTSWFPGFGGDPNDGGAGEDYLELWDGTGEWVDDGGPNDPGWALHYVIEWDAGLMSDDNAIDTLSGQDGDDIVYGYGGDDFLSGEDGDDILIGGAGEDAMYGGNDDDQLLGGDGDDTMHGDGGDDLMYGGDGADDMYGAFENDTMYGEDGDDYMAGKEDDDTMYGGAGVDTITAGSGADIVYGGDGNDTIYGDTGFDAFDLGADDDDYINGEDGNDIISGEGGNDVLVGGDGADTITGGDGNDVLHGHGITEAEVETILAANPNIFFYARTNSFYESVVTNVTQANAEANAAASIVNGLAGHLVNATTAEENNLGLLVSITDFWIGASDADKEGEWIWTNGPEEGVFFYDANAGSAITSLYSNWQGGQPNDSGSGQDYAVFRTGVGDWFDDGAPNNAGSLIDYGIEWDAGMMNDDNAVDTLAGGAGNDHIYGYGGDDILDGDDGDDLLIGGAGNDTMHGDADDDSLYGGDGADLMYGDDGDDIIDGGSGVDTIYAKEDDDTVYGGTGADNITGGSGLDIIYGGDDGDTIYGDTGLDAFDVGADAADSINGEDGNDTIYGEGGGDFLIGGAGADTIDGGAGNDVLYGHGLDRAAINTILNANAGVIFNEQTNSFYQFVTSGANATTSATLAAGTTLNGLAGHLAVVTTQAELDFLDAQVNPTNNTSTGSYWVNGDDTGTEGDWVWTAGVEAGMEFWVGNSGGTAVNNFDNLWDPGQPNDSDGTQDYAYLLSYNDALADAGVGGFAHSVGYIIEWEAGLMGDDDAADILSGGAGDDILYGHDGDDVLNGGADDDILIVGDSGDNTMNGDAGNDVLYGAAGDNILNGGAGDDIIYSGSTDLINPDITSILAANAGVVYNNETNSFYQYVTTGVTESAAFSAAAAATLTGYAGATGHLVNITSATENAYIDTIITSDIWLGGTDSGTEGAWIWVAGDEAGQQFWSGAVAGSAVNGMYENWAANEPNDYQSGEDYMEYNDGAGTWNDNGSPEFPTRTFDYVIEWDGSALVASTDKNTINGGTGDDDLYGGDGIDAFIFDNTSSTDTVYDFDTTERDYLDISSIISYNSLTHDITDFVTLTESGGNTTVAVDANGASGGASFTNIAVLNGVTGLDLALIVAGDNLILE